MLMRDLHLFSQKATLADDGIPLHYGELRAEYHAALENEVIMDRSHESRIEISGRDRFNLLHRISTNDLMNMSPGEGRPTIFTNANARILDRVIVYNRGEQALIITEPGRGAAVVSYLQRNIFFNDDFQITDLSTATHLFALHGPQADAVMEVWSLDITQQAHSADLTVNEVPVFVARRTPVSGAHWVIVVPVEHAAAIWSSLLEVGATYGLTPAGSLTYNALRIRAGRPAIGRELSQEYIPLEAGLWDEVSFSKGCYTGQEIIARMESRNRLAKIMVTLELDTRVEAPTELYCEGRKTGTLTSSVTTPDGEHLAIGFVKVSDAQPGARLTIGTSDTQVTITSLAGTPPPQLAEITQKAQ
jgi:folate-binding protein YgfZ